MYNPQNPLIVQSDYTLFLEIYNPLGKEAEDKIRLFSELEKALDYIHNFKITTLSLWNAASIGLTYDNIISILEKYSKFPIPENVREFIKDTLDRYGILVIYKDSNDKYILEAKETYLIDEVYNRKPFNEFFIRRISDSKVEFNPFYRGRLKSEFIKLGYPVDDRIGFIEGNHLDIELLNITKSGKEFKLRDYQQQAVDAFIKSKDDTQSFGVIVLPCGAGKTIVGIGVMTKVKEHTLILVTNITSLKQWKREIIDKTTLTEDQIGEFSSEKKEIKPVTIATYNILTYRKSKKEDYKYFNIFSENNWGLIIYDEVHLLPAPVFKITSEIQSKRRLGLTATLVREDGKEDEVFSLIGPKKYDMSWKDLESMGFIAKAVCREIKVELPDELKRKYATASDREKFKIASMNPKKLDILKKLLEKHKDEYILIIGQYIEQLKSISKELDLPLIIGETSDSKREELYEKFKKGKITRLIVSKVANFSVDLPDASVAIQISGTFGSRQEEAQRLGRILRPKKDGRTAYFYNIVTKDTVEENFAFKRQSFLVMQGYKYEIYREDQI